MPDTDLEAKVAALEARLALVEQAPPPEPEPKPAPKTSNLTFEEAAVFLRQGARVARAHTSWKTASAYLSDAGLLPHWGMTAYGAAPRPWPDSMRDSQTWRMDVKATDWQVLS